jgi:hypothetical protein
MLPERVYDCAGDVSELARLCAGMERDGDTIDGSTKWSDELSSAAERAACAACSRSCDINSILAHPA